MADEQLAIIRIRGETGVKYDIDQTLTQLGLTRKNSCVVVPKNPTFKGMVAKVKDFVTWGEVTGDMFGLLVEKRGEEYKGRTQDSKGIITYKKFITVGDKKYKKRFSLNSPKKGYGKGGIKTAFNAGGSLGYRGDKINDLIKNMVE